MELTAVLPYVGTALGGVATAIASYHFRGKEALRAQVARNAQEILKLKAQQTSDARLTQQKLGSLEAELRDTKESVKDDVGEIKSAISTLSASMSALAESQGELRGTIIALVKN